MSVCKAGFLQHWNNFGQMPFLMLPTTHVHLRDNLRWADDWKFKKNKHYAKKESTQCSLYSKQNSSTVVTGLTSCHSESPPTRPSRQAGQGCAVAREGQTVGAPR